MKVIQLLHNQKGNFTIFSIAGLFMLFALGATVYMTTRPTPQDVRSFAQAPKASTKVKKTPEPTAQAAAPSPSPQLELSTSDALDAIEKDILSTDPIIQSIDEDTAKVLGIATSL